MNVSPFGLLSRLSVALLAFALLAAARAQTQLTTLGAGQNATLQDLTPPASISQSSWIGFSFTTGASGGGFSFSSFVASIKELGAGGYTNPTALLFFGDGSGLVNLGAGPQGAFTTSSTITTGFSNVTFLPTSALTLAGSTEYVIAITPGAGNTGTWDWAATLGSSTGWTMNPGAIFYDNIGASGNVFLTGSTSHRLMASIDATPIPEPETTALLAGLAMAGAAAALRRRRRVA